MKGRALRRATLKARPERLILLGPREASRTLNPSWMDTMEIATQEATGDVVLTERAARRVAKIMQSEQPGSALRISVNGGGCSGFQYAFDIVQDRADDDLTLERDGATVLIDPVSLEYMKGCKIDFVDNLIGQSFQIDNPNATASCGCGTSFSM